MIGRTQRAPETNALGEFHTGQSLTDAVAADVGDLAQSIEQAKRLQDGDVDADAGIGVARFPLLRSSGT